MAVPTLAEMKKAKAEIVSKALPLHKQRDELRGKIQGLEKQRQELKKKIQAIEIPELGELNSILAPIERKEARKARDAA